MSENSRYFSTIARLRKEAGFSQEELAARAGIGRATLQNIERGVSSTTVETLNAICTALGVTLQQIFTLRAPNEGSTPISEVSRKLASSLAKENEDARIADQNSRMSKGAIEHSLIEVSPTQRAMAETILEQQKEIDALREMLEIFENASEARQKIARLILTGSPDDKKAVLELIHAAGSQNDVQEVVSLFGQPTRSK